MYKFSFLLLLLLFISVSGNAQPYYFKQYQADDGLAHNSISTILQDSKGLIWIGTRGGLNRFDGYTFKTYKNEKSKFGNIGNNVIISIAEDKNHMLWIGTGKGIFKYDPLKELFTTIDDAPEEYVSHIVIDSKNNVFFLADSKLYQYTQKGNEVTDLKMEASSIAIDNQMNLWMGNDDGLLSCYNLNTKRKTSVRIIDKNIPLNLRSISKVFPIKNNEILVGCFKQGLKSYNTKTGIIKSLPLRNSDNTDIYVRDVTAENDHKFWVATESGIYIYDLTTNTSTNLRKRSGDPYSLADNAVYTVCMDDKGGMWAGTFFGGVNYYSKENARFEKYYPLLGTNSISGNAVREISSDNKGNLWIGTEDAGVNKFNLETGRFTNYTSTGKSTDVSYPNIHGLLAIDNQLFIGSFLHGMEIMDMRTGRITDRFKLIGDKNDKVSDFVLCIYLTRDSTLLVGTAYKSSGLFTYDRKAKNFARIKQIPFNSYVFDIEEDKHGNIWTGSVSQGAFYYHPKTGKSGNIRFGDKVKNKVTNEFPVYGILEDSSGSIWFTTEGGGLIKLSADHKVMKKFTTENGLPTNVMFRALEDDSKHLWISSLKGLICLDLKTEKFKIYTQANGLITDQFNFNSAYKDPENGKMYFGSVKGMIGFNPKDFEKKEKGPAIYITGFQINNQEVSPNLKNTIGKSILYTDTVELGYNQNNFSIEFAAINYSSPEVTRYEYLMEGLDKNRTYLSSNRKAYFTDLSAGTYTFIVRAKSNIGSWESAEKRIFIKILPPFWKSYTAYFIYAVLFIFVLFYAIRYYHRYLEHKNMNKLRLFEHEKEKEIYQAKIEFFTNIAHEIQTPLTLILGPIERIIKKTDEHLGIKKSLLMIEKNAKRLAELTSQLLDFRKTEMHQFGLNFVNTDIILLLKDQVNVFKEEANKSNIILTLELPKNQFIVFADTEALVKICSNLISNALKYSATIATVQLLPIHPKDQQFTIRFSNDGKGIPDEFGNKIFEPFFRLHGKNKPGTGIGLSLAKSLTELHNGTLKLISAEANNVIFELTLPIHQEIEFKLSSWKKIKQV
ncbi:MAG: sensor histidine kinase [Pedobacter sp.]|nr:MAG: sensor histidine kinase [Pedobacter sp.]